MIKQVVFGMALLCFYGTAQANEIVVPMHLVNEQGTGMPVGQVMISESPYGLVFTPHIQDLPLRQGLHGFHIHENPSCLAKEQDGKMGAALAAGGHYDPKASKRHDFPWNDGHLGDLPALYVDESGQAFSPVLAPRLKTLDEVRGRSLMIHAGSDNYSDHPAALGGGGARNVCGVIR